MSRGCEAELQSFIKGIMARSPGEAEFHQAVEEVAASVLPFVLENPQYKEAKILERLTEPDRVIMFRVCWEDDKGVVNMNRGYRVQFSNAIGPYKGGIRFHPSVNLSILKFLGFEQIFKNSLTTLPMGGGKGGANFDPKGKSEREIMRFCQAFMCELFRHIGKDTDVPAGDIGVGGREVSYLFGQYKRLQNEFTGVLTGKGLAFGGSNIRPEATGYGCVYFAQEMLARKGDSLSGKICLVSGSGNVAQYSVEKATQLGGKVVSMSDSDGTIYDAKGITVEKLSWAVDLKNNRRGRIAEYAEKFKCEYYAGKRPWGIKCDVAFPSATQNEISEQDAKELVKNGCKIVAEGANMPSTPEAVRVLQNGKVLFAPGKAANAGGVSVSGLEMTQNSMRLTWTREEVDDRLQGIMRKIHEQCVSYGAAKDGHVDYVQGANIAGFKKVADAMLAFGIM